jgi:hypothetical protein
VGRWGEELVYHYLTAQVAAATQAALENGGSAAAVVDAAQQPGGDRWLAGCEVVWLNEDEESGLPYDLIIRWDPSLV